MPKAGYTHRKTSTRRRSEKIQKEPPQCSFCGGPVTANVQHSRVCNEYRKARQDAYQHVIEQKRNRESALKRLDTSDLTPELPDLQPMDTFPDEIYPSEDTIAQLPNPELFALMDVDSNQDSGNSHYTPTVELPARFIFVKHHPHADKPNEIIPLNGTAETPAGPEPVPTASATLTERPWAPFRTYADFKFVSRRIKRRSPNTEID
ncbi:hypothetical protein B0H10DRAFT_2209941 [Mycena sp. CBHHK59/15]|nr:hypothetical protein B0H10DRAFT_2209941 [Mycena sp. CBHHK59/15]